MDLREFMREVADINARMDELDRALFEQKIQLFALGIEVDELKNMVDDTARRWE